MKNLLQGVLRRFGYELRSLDGTALGPDIRMAEFDHDGVDIAFIVVKPDDFIQSQHLAGHFYEPDELASIQRHVPATGVFVDIGANVGNHLVFFAKVMGIGRLIAFEPGTSQMALLRANLSLNGIADRVEARKVALSEQAGEGYLRARSSINLGASFLSDDRAGYGETVDVSTGDIELADVPVSFLKIDVEAKELEVLRGLSGTIAKHRPWIFIEVLSENASAVDEELAGHSYRPVERLVMYEGSENILYAPN